MNELKYLFKPSSIAVVGASREPSKLGHLIFNNLIAARFTGKLYPVNPNAKRIDSFKCYPRVTDIVGNVDLAVIAVPASLVYPIVEDLVRKKVKVAIIISSGFAEMGSEGKVLQDKIVRIAKTGNLRILGPNCLGIISSLNKVNASFGEYQKVAGNIAFVSQSGALGTAILDWAKAEKIGFGHFVSLGNKTDISENDVLGYLAKDRKIAVVACYLESFSNGKVFIQKAKELTKKKPLIVLKAGRSEQAKVAVTSHTGVMAGNEEAARAAIAQSGAIYAESIEEFFDLVKAFSYEEPPKGGDVAIVTNAGGPGVLATDALSSEGLTLATFSKETTLRLRKVLPANASVKNPVDLVGDALAERYEKALKAVVAEKSEDAIVVILTPQINTEVEKTAEFIGKIAKKTKKPVFASFIGGERIRAGVEILNKYKVPTFSFPENAVRALEVMFRYLEEKDFPRPVSLKRRFPLKVKNEALKIIECCGVRPGGKLPDELAFQIAALYKIPTTTVIPVFSKGDAMEAARYIGLPVAMKVDLPNSFHRTEKGGVRLDISTFEKVSAAYSELKNLDGNVLVQEMVPDGVEIILGGKKDYDFGSLLMFGMGGVYTEVLRDLSFGVAPLSYNDSLRMVKSTKVYKILSGARGFTYDVEKVVHCLLSLSQLMHDLPLSEVDINPLIVTKDGVRAVDVKMRFA